MWTPAARSHLLQMPARTGTAATSSRWCWPERNHNLAGTKAEMTKNHTRSVAASLLRCGLVFVLLPSLMLRTLTVLLLPKQQQVGVARTPAYLHAFLPPQGHIPFAFFAQETLTCHF